MAVLRSFRCPTPVTADQVDRDQYHALNGEFERGRGTPMDEGERAQPEDNGCPEQEHVASDGQFIVHERLDPFSPMIASL